MLERPGKIPRLCVCTLLWMQLINRPHQIDRATPWCGGIARHELLCLPVLELLEGCKEIYLEEVKTQSETSTKTLSGEVGIN